MLAFRCTAKTAEEETWSLAAASAGDMESGGCQDHWACLAGLHVAHSLGSLAGKPDPWVSATYSPAGACERMRHGGDLHVLKAAGGVNLSTTEDAEAALWQAWCLDSWEYHAAVRQAPKHAEVLFRRDQYGARLLACIPREDVPGHLLARSECWGDLSSEEQRSLESELLVWAAGVVGGRPVCAECS